MSLFSIEDSKLISLRGEVSHFYKKELVDFEAEDESFQATILSEIEHFLMTMVHPTKIYFLKDSAFFNIFSDEAKTSFNLQLAKRPLQTLGFDVESVQIYDNYLTISSEYLALLSVEEFMDSLSPLEFRSFPEFILNVAPISKVKAKEKINLKRKLNYSFLFNGMKNVEAEEAYQQAESLLTEITSDQVALVRTEMFFIIKAKTKCELDQKCEHFAQFFKDRNGLLKREERGLSFFFQTILPGVMPSFKRAQELPSSFVSLLIPHHKDRLYEAGVEFLSTFSKSVYLDLFNHSNTNFNVLISGDSGQGKSMLANKLLKSELEAGTKALVLDHGNSFCKNTMFHGGSVLSNQFNPLQFKNPAYLKAFVLACIEENLSKKEQGRLFEVIREILDRNELLSWGTFITELEKEFTGIRYYFSEIEQYFVDACTDLSRLTYCDLFAYPESMKAPMIIFLLECFKSMEGRKLFVFDECWNLLSRNADYIAECFRTFRKYGASAVAISQSIDDFSSSQLGKVIIQNSFHKFLFKQPIFPSEFVSPRLAELVGEVCSKKGVYSEFIYSNDTIKKCLRYSSTYLEYELFTSDKQDRSLFDGYMSEKGKFLSFPEAMRNWVQIRYPMEGLL